MLLLEIFAGCAVLFFRSCCSHSLHASFSIFRRALCELLFSGFHHCQLVLSVCLRTPTTLGSIRFNIYWTAYSSIMLSTPAIPIPSQKSVVFWSMSFHLFSSKMCSGSSSIVFTAVTVWYFKCYWSHIHQH